jgi:small nuclear ribonucleoprotein (snRNP)-like protein
MSVISNYHKCARYLNRRVRIRAKNGNVYTGRIVKVDAKKVYLKVSSVHDGKKVHSSFFPFILPLVLFDLLAIVLLF